MGQFIDRVGQRFSRLEVLSLYPERTRTGLIQWSCRCDCGKILVVRGCNLQSGNSRSCGCLAKEETKARSQTHGYTRTSIYSIWNTMCQRCTNLDCIAYTSYGARGVQVCARWLESFENFLEDMGDKPTGMTLDRIDNDGNYCKENCRWASRKVQANNRRSNHLLDHDGQQLTITQWSELMGIGRSVISARLRTLGWSIDRAITTPVRQKAGKLPKQKPSPKHITTIGEDQ